MKLSKITKCRECGSESLTWGTHNKNIGQASHGRLTTHDVRCLFVLGCDECSETLDVVDADKVAVWLTRGSDVSVEQSSTPSCAWTFNEDSFAWGTTCSASFMLTEDGPRENGMRFCPYCSKSIIQTPISEEMEANREQ